MQSYERGNNKEKQVSGIKEGQKAPLAAGPRKKPRKRKKKQNPA